MKDLDNKKLLLDQRSYDLWEELFQDLKSESLESGKAQAVLQEFSAQMTEEHARWASEHTFSPYEELEQEVETHENEPEARELFEKEESMLTPFFGGDAHEEFPRSEPEYEVSQKPWSLPSINKKLLHIFRTILLTI